MCACTSIFFLIEIQLNDDNEKLQRQVTTKDGGQDSGSDAELRRLRAENAALQKSLTSMCTKLMQRYDIRLQPFVILWKTFEKPKLSVSSPVFLYLSMSWPIEIWVIWNIVVLCVFTSLFFSLLKFSLAWSINPVTPKISLVILLTVCYTVVVMLVWRIWYWIN